MSGHPQWVAPPPCKWIDAGSEKPCGQRGRYLAGSMILCEYHGQRARRAGRQVRLIPKLAMR